MVGTVGGRFKFESRIHKGSADLIYGDMALSPEAVTLILRVAGRSVGRPHPRREWDHVFGLCDGGDRPIWRKGPSRLILWA